MTAAAGLRVTVRRGLRPGHGELVFAGDHVLVRLPGVDPPQWTPRDQVPELLARVCGLRPRPVVGRAAVLITERSTVDTYVALAGAADEAAVRRCFGATRLSEDWVGRLCAVAGLVESHWEVATLSADGAVAPWLEVVDAGPAGGLWSVTPATAQLLAAADDGPISGDELVAFVPVTTTAIWAALSTCAADPDNAANRG